MKVLVKKGTTSYIARLFIQDSTVTTGAGKTGLTSSSLSCYRARDDDGNAGGTQLSLTAGTKGTWSSGGFVEKDSTNMPGVYELGLDNNGLVTGSNSVLYMLTGTNVAPVVLEIQLVNFDPNDGVHLGLTSLPNTAVTTNASLLTSGTGTDQLHVVTGVADANPTKWNGGTIPAANVTGVPLVDLKYTLGTLSPAAAGSVSPDWGQVVNKTAAVDLSNTTIKNLDGNTVQTGDAYAIVSNATYGNSALLSAVSNIAVTSAALNATAASATYTTGTDTGGVANTNTLDGVFDSVADSAGTTDFYYQFNLGTTGQTGVGVTWDGYLSGAVNTMKVYAYNWGGASWDQIGTLQGIAGTTVGSQEWDLTSAHTGTGGNLGQVRIRFSNTGLTSSSTKTDRILCGYVNVVTPPANWSSMKVSASGYVSPNWGDVGSPTTTVALTGTTLSTSQVVASVSGAVGSVTGNVGGDVVGNVDGTVADVVAAVSVDTNLDKHGYFLDPSQSLPTSYGL